MTRAVAAPDIKLAEGIHYEPMFRGLAVTLRYPDGMRQTVPWSEQDIATPVLIESMLQDMKEDLPDDEIRDAVKKHCLEYLEGWNELIEDPEKEGMPLADFYTQAEAFIKGWKAARNGRQ